MTKIIPDSFLDLFNKPAFGHLATLMPDGSPQVSPLWVDYDGQYILINSALNRQKDRNMRRDGRVAIEIQDPQNAYRYLLIRGRVVEITSNNANSHIESLALKYTGQKYGGWQEGMVRVIYKIEPDQVFTSGA